MIIRPLSSRLALVAFLAPLLLIGCSSGGGSGDGDLALADQSESPDVVVPERTSSETVLVRSGVLPVSAVRPYRPDSPVAGVLKKCVLVNTVADSCSFDTLPLIPTGDGTPSVDDILDRVLVTHDWMGDRFADVLKRAPAALRYLFGSTTAILIGSDVRPSFYSRTNGAIQLDPDYLWTTLSEKQTISVDEDYRSGFGRDLQFWGFVSRRLDGKRAWNYFNLEDRSTRTLDEMYLPLMALLYHELGHANDYLPRSSLPLIDTSLPVREAISALNDRRISYLMLNDAPLQSKLLTGLAEVRYRDAQPLDAEVAATASDVGLAFEPDGAVSFYSYSTEREDMANLVEASMMGFYHNVTTNVGFTAKPADIDNYRCDELATGWGAYNRLADVNVAYRAQRVLDQVVPPNPELKQFLASGSGKETFMTPGLSWCDNLDRTPVVTVAIPAAATSAGSNSANVAESGGTYRSVSSEASAVPDNPGHSQKEMLRRDQLSR